MVVVVVVGTDVDVVVVVAMGWPATMESRARRMWLPNLTPPWAFI